MVDHLHVALVEHILSVLKFCQVLRYQPVDLLGCLVVHEKELVGPVMDVQVAHRFDAKWIQIGVVESLQVGNDVLLLLFKVAFLFVHLVEHLFVAERFDVFLLIDLQVPRLLHDNCGDQVCLDLVNLLICPFGGDLLCNGCVRHG